MSQEIQPLPADEFRPSRAEINRANSQHSTGPRTAEGKANSKGNSFKHGLYSTELVLPDEDPAELDDLRASLRADHQPANETEEILVNEIAEHFWRLRRMRKFEARGMQPENFDNWFQHGLLALVARNMASAERGMHRAISALRQVRKDSVATKQQDLPAESGFVPPKLTTAEPDAEVTITENREEHGFVPSKRLASPFPSTREHKLPRPEPPPAHQIAA